MTDRTKSPHSPLSYPADSDRLETRIDAPHILATDLHAAIGEDKPAVTAPRSSSGRGFEARHETPAESVWDDDAADGDVLARGAHSVATADALQSQADQLASYLREQQQEVDHRESQLNARTAQFEALVRRTKISILRQQSELDQREATITDTEAELREQAIRLTTDQHAVQEERRHHEAELAEGRRQLEQKQAELEAATAQLARQEQQLEGKRRRFAQDEEKYRKMRQAERLLAEAQAETARVREGLVRQRHAMQKEYRNEKNRLEAAFQEQSQALSAQRAAIAERDRQLDISRTALETAREELGRMHRETLEIRLATEELWLQLSNEAPSDALKKSLGQIRAHLADQYRSAIARVARQKQELEEVRNQLADQYKTIVERKREVDAWTQSREALLADRETALAQRERELERRETTFDALAREWFERRGSDDGQEDRVDRGDRSRTNT